MSWSREGTAFVLASSAASALVTSLYIESWFRAPWLPYPKLAFLLEPLLEPRWFAPLLSSMISCLVGLGLFRGSAPLPRANTVFLLFLTVLVPLNLLGQWAQVRHHVDRLQVAASVVTVIIEFIALLGIWVTWVVARRSTSLLARTLFSCLLTIYLINLWTGSGFIIVGL